MLTVTMYNSPVFLAFGVPLIAAPPNGVLAEYDVLARIISNRSVWPLEAVPGETIISGPLSGPPMPVVQFSTRPTSLIYSLGEDYWTFPSRATSTSLLYQSLASMRITDSPKGEFPVVHSNLSGSGTLIESPFSVQRLGLVGYNTGYFGAQAPGHRFSAESQVLSYYTLSSWPSYRVHPTQVHVSLINLGDWYGEETAYFSRYVLPYFRAVEYMDLKVHVDFARIQYKMRIGAVPGPNQYQVWSNSTTFLVEHRITDNGWLDFTDPAPPLTYVTTRRRALQVKSKYTVVDRTGNQALVGDVPDALRYTTSSSEPVCLHNLVGVGTPDVGITGKLRAVTDKYASIVDRILPDLTDLVAYSTADAVKKHAFADGNLLEFLSEIRTIASTLPNIRGLLELMNSAGAKNRGRGSLASIVQYLASENLRYKFGLGPNLQLLTNLKNTLSRIDNAGKEFSKSVWYGSHSLNIAEGTYKDLGPAKVSLRTTIKWNEGHLPLSSTGEDVLGLNVAGLTPLFSNLWDLVPWSFAVDWLLQIGSLLSRFESMALLSALAPRVLIHTINVSVPLTGTPIHGKGLYRTFFRRYVSKFVPGLPKGPLAEPKLNLRDLTLPVSLIASR